MDESVQETEKKKRYAAQGWDALRDSSIFEVLWKHRDVFPEEVPSRLPADRGIGHEIDLKPGTKYLYDQAMAVAERASRLYR